MTATALEQGIESAAAAELQSQLAALTPISLDAIGRGNLQERFDTKFLMSVLDLPALIGAVAGEYRVLEVNGKRLQGYETLYFDTPDFALYRAQHAGRSDRYKVRSRRYVETGETFLEVKRKDSRNRTVKSRLPTPTLVSELDSDGTAFVGQHLPLKAPLEPTLWNRFSRITLARCDEAERLTFDLDLSFNDEQHAVSIPGVVVAELKQERANLGSPFLRETRRRGIHPTGFSKYCIGAALLNADLKHNRFKPELLRSQRLSKRYLNR